ncbi:hypothetical protein [Solilutibacter silvestris]|uniref:Uncharacterized protein n=1 Tax=Solilutibacter silvestris TaxID=1645665 RepID=A0A2K1Q1E0_9GAMM|nr:hypothetical protein [Lysobacter silvestris]PNS08868.1 hypothetical protein Lysil_0497 [Lysobacter silvestris]
MNKDLEALTFIRAGWYISYMNYCATGEGVTSIIAVSGSAERSEKLLKYQLPGYFHPHIVTAPIDAYADMEVAKMIEWIPDAAKRILQQIPPASGEYVAHLHYNLS